MKYIDIYQRIYNTDVNEGSGLRAVTSIDNVVDESAGYVLVEESFDKSNPTTLFKDVRLPDCKRNTFDLAEKLFDNYDILASIADDITPDEEEEAEELLAAIVDSPPMRLARSYIAERSGRTIRDFAWYASVKETWFRRFQVGSSPTRSGFEHVFLGEQKGNTVGGLHWWYYYYRKLREFDYGGAIYNISDPDSGIQYPELATMSFTWDVEGNTILKKIGGFFVGLSVEGLMAMGMVRASRDAGAPNIAVIEGAEIELKLFKSPDNRSVNTFYPVLKRVFVGTASPSEPPMTTTPPPPPTNSGAVGGVRIVSVLANPAGQDVGFEKVTFLNTHGDGEVSMKGWKLEGPNGVAMRLGDISLDVGEAYTLTLPGHAGTVQLSNKGGAVKLYNARGEEVQSLVYAGEDAKVQGGVLLWDGTNENLILME